MINFIFIAVFSFCCMEFVAWFSHKYIMHGVLWKLHKDHHVPNGKNSVFQVNDSFFVIFAVPSAVFFILGFVLSRYQLIAVAVGILMYGVAYFFVHELFIHQRLPFLKKTKNKYLLALRRAHKVHHKHLEKEDGECFGMLVFPKKYFK